MPRDRNGNHLKPGDIVGVRFVVKGIDPQDDFFNVALESVEPTFPGNAKLNTIVNTKQVELIEPLGESNPDMDVKAAIERLSQSGEMKAIP